jgi:hypothetical protein
MNNGNRVQPEELMLISTFKGELAQRKPAEAREPEKQPPPPCDHFTFGEIARGIAELTICLVILTIPIWLGSPQALVLMAIGGFVVIALALWDDHSRRSGT